MDKKISLDQFCDILSKFSMEFTDFILEDWESTEKGNTKLEGMTIEEWKKLYIKFISKNFD